MRGIKHKLAPLDPPAKGQPAPGCGADEACAFAWDSGVIENYVGCSALQCPQSYADASPITADDVKMASITAIAALDESFFRVRFDRLTPSEKRYLRAMAELGAGPHRSGDIAEALGRQVNSFGPTRNQLISKGMIWSPNHGDTAFTVPLFDAFMHRIMPSDDWKTL